MSFHRTVSCPCSCIVRCPDPEPHCSWAGQERKQKNNKTKKQKLSLVTSSFSARLVLLVAFGLAVRASLLVAEKFVLSWLLTYTILADADTSQWPPLQTLNSRLQQQQQQRLCGSYVSLAFLTFTLAGLAMQRSRTRAAGFTARWSGSVSVRPLSSAASPLRAH